MTMNNAGWKVSVTVAAVLAAGRIALPQPDLSTRPGEAVSQPATTAPAGARVTEEGWFAPTRRGMELPPLPAEVAKVFVVPIREEITDKTFEALRRKAALCKGAGAELIVFDMDTWGGQVLAALDISRLIKVDLADIRTMCFVNTRGVSAGALIAMACDEIVITPAGTLGDCAPIVMGGTLQGIEREKIETVLRTEFTESAERNGYSTALAQSIVSASLEVWLIRNKASRELRYVLSDEYRARVDMGEGSTTRPAGAEWELLRVVVPEGRLLTMHPRQAQEYGFAQEIIKAPEGEPYSLLAKRYNIVQPLRVLKDTWSEKLVEVLTHPGITGLLFFIGILGIWVELHTPGVGLPGLVAVICFAILFGSRFLIGMATWWEIALFALGLVLLFVEIFVTPGFGVIGIAGILCCVAGLLGILVDNPPNRLPIPETDLDWTVFTNGLLAMIIGFVGAAAAAAVLSRFLPKVPLARRLILAPVTLGPDDSLAPGSPILRIAAGATGTVEGPCRPVGKVRFGADLIDAVSQGSIIEAGAKVRVLRREGNRVVVERTN